MSDTAHNSDIEDVLSSIRKLVSHDASAARPAAEPLVLSPALRVREGQPPSRAPAEPGQPQVEEAGFIAVDDDGEECSARVTPLHPVVSADTAGAPEASDLRDTAAMDGAEAEQAILSVLAGEDTQHSARRHLPQDMSGLRKLISEALGAELHNDPHGPLATALRELIRDEIARMLGEGDAL